MAFLTKRTLKREHMDDPNASREELASALHFLRVINKRMGGAKAALRHIQRWTALWPAERTIKIIDIGTGSADIPLAIAHWARRAGRRVHIIAIELHPVTVELAREHVRDHPEIEVIQADALKLGERFDAGSFDFAHAGLFLHHLQDVEVMTVLRIMDRLASTGMIWNDLVRSRFSRWGVWLATCGPQIPNMVRHDALVSVDAAFTIVEALDLAQRAGWNRIAYARHLVHRFTLTGQKSL
jgi:SAM-dependent methyltransferase